MSDTKSPVDDELRFVNEQIQIETLEAQVARLEQDRESLRERVTTLEAQLRSLEDERDLLEATVEHKEHQRQQVIETYERILAEKHQRDTETTRAEATTALSTPVRVLKKSACRLRQRAVKRKPSD